MRSSSGFIALALSGRPVPAATVEEMISLKRSMAPVGSANARLLLLGSLPGEASLRAERYYAHPQNQFWRLIGAVIGREDFRQLDYEARLASLAAAGVGLWDVVADAVRAGSLDGAIRDHRPNE